MKTTTSKPRYGIDSDPEHLPKLTVTQEDVDAAAAEAFGTEDEIRLLPVSAFTSSNWSRLSDRYYRERVVHVRSNRTLLLRFDYDYGVDLDRINSEADLIRLTRHFCEKVWMTTERLGCFNRRGRGNQAAENLRLYEPDTPTECTLSALLGLQLLRYLCRLLDERFRERSPLWRILAGGR
jgi:hypothetical protein